MREAPMNSLSVPGPGEHIVDIHGVPQRYHVAGSGPVCIAHSGGPGVGWEYLRMPHLEEFLTMVYVEPVGTGKSGRLPQHPHGYTIDRYIAHIDGIVDDIGRRSVILLGHSYGGLIAQKYALARSEKLSSVILYATVTTDGDDFYAEVERNFQEFLRRHSDAPDLDDVKQAYMQGYRGDATAHDDESLTAIFRQVLPIYFADYWRREHEFGSLRQGARRAYVVDDGRPNDHRGQLSAIVTPTLVTTGRFDVVCPPRWSEEIHEEINGSALVILEESGHMAHLEQPQKFAQTVKDFLDHRPRTAG
ncbi:alpha/beta fold hydrolase [Pseudonocardia sp. CA-142604]|uniref:alpha/beta fold hydrolase n=1 Tax=Pseudonocardia sp. CA-142604 TaxID=3240024 RepID=UPI003D8F2DAA